jgi:hypothetical protein
MPQQKLSPLEARKQLLIAESEINRVLLAREYKALADGVRAAIKPVGILGALAVSAIPLMAAFRGQRNQKSGAEPSRGFRWMAWLSRLGLDLWIGLRGKKTAVNSKAESNHGNRHEVSAH